MLRLILPVLALTLAGCARGTIELDDDDDDTTDDTGEIASDGGAQDGGSEDGGSEDGGSADGGSADGGSSSGDGGSSSGDGGGSGADYTGLYQGPMAVFALGDWGEYEVGSCEMNVTLMPDASVGGGGTCTATGWGTVDAAISATVAGDGTISGGVTLDLGYDVGFPLEGQVDGGGTMELHFEGDVGYGGTSLRGEALLTRS